MRGSVCEWDKHPSLPRSEVSRVAGLMVERHGFRSLDQDMVNEVAYFVYVASFSYERLAVYNPRSAEKILDEIADLKRHAKSMRQTLCVSKARQEIRFRINHQALADIAGKVDKTLSEMLALLTDDRCLKISNTRFDQDPTEPFSQNLKDIRGDIADEMEIDEIEFNLQMIDFPNCNQWLSGYALPVIYFTTYFEERTGGSAADGEDKVGPLYTFVKELFSSIAGRLIRGDTIQKNKRRLLDPRLRWALPR